jgi:methylglyoxal/glyoxal reductase
MAGLTPEATPPVTLRSLADTVEIAPGVRMNRLGLGTYRAADGPDVLGEVSAALPLGYRLVDTAALYGNEHSVGRAIAQSGVPREQVFVTTKLWNTEQEPGRVAPAFAHSLELLGMDYVDLYLIHWPRPSRTQSTWRAMEELLTSGRTRAIGVCNFLPHPLEQLLATATVAPAVHQVEFHPRLQQPELVSYCRDAGITMQAWAPIMRGAVASIPEIVRIAQRHDKTAAQVSIRWILQQGITTIPKSVHSERIAENADVFDFELSEAEMAALAALDTGERIGPHPDRYGESS